MGDEYLVVDHLRLDYTGPFDATELFRHISGFLKERGFDLKIDKEFEHNTENGKFIEWQIEPWKRITGYMRYWVKVRVLITNYKKVDALHHDKKTKIGHGRVEIFLDGSMELDYLNKWEHKPLLQFIRVLSNRFLFKVYTERFEQRITHDTYHLYHTIEQFFNMNRKYKVVSKVAPFIAAH